LEGAAIQIDEQIAHTKMEHTWTALLERIRDAREQALEKPAFPTEALPFAPFWKTAHSLASPTKSSVPSTISVMSKGWLTALHGLSINSFPTPVSTLREIFPCI
jgi:hypothetical protein